MGTDPEAELTLAEARAKLDRLTPAQANAAHHDGAILIDIRSELQRSTDGELPGAKRFPATPPIAIRRWRAATSN